MKDGYEMDENLSKLMKMHEKWTLTVPMNPFYSCTHNIKNYDLTKSG
jgi:hypothetical protein